MLVFLRDSLGYIVTGMCMYAIYITGYEIFLKIKKRGVSWVNRICMLVLGIYLTIVFSVTVSPMYGFSWSIDWTRLNLIPGQMLIEEPINGLNIFGNIIMFMPFGLAIPLIARRFQKFGSILLLGLGISFTIEFLQLFLGRGSDVDDILLNTAGCLLGFYVCKVLFILSPKLRRVTKVTGNMNRSSDRTPVIVLIVLMLFSVIATGFYKRNNYMKVAREHASQLQDISKNVETEVLDTIISSQKVEAVKAQESKNSEESKDIEDQQKEEDLQVSTKIKNQPILYQPVQPDVRFENKQFNAKNICLVNGTNRTIIFSQNRNEKIAPASTTKILTALTVLSFCDVEDKITVGDEINLVAADASKAWVSKGNTLTVKQLLEGLLLPSGNDAAYALAAHTGRIVARDESLEPSEAVRIFVAKMNEKALEIGATDSNFITPDGYDDEGQYTTAYDLACIATAFLESSDGEGILRNIVNMVSQEERLPNGPTFTWQNSNELINPSSPYYYKEAMGIKTGSSSKAGKCLVSGATINDSMYIAVVMGASESGRYEDSIALYDLVKK